MTGLKNGSLWKGLSSRCTLAVLLFAGILARTDAATTFTLSQNNSSAQINVVNTASNPAGMSNWLVDGVNQMRQQWFYYRAGNNGGPALPIDVIGAPVALQPNSRNLTVTYANADYSVKVAYLFTGSSLGSGYAQIGETITILNKSTASSLPFHFFNYTDLDLVGRSDLQSIQFNQNDSGVVNSFSQTLGLASATNTLTSGLTALTHFEAGLFDQTLAGITSGTRTSLNDNPGAGPGNVTGAWQWDVTLAPSGTAGDGLVISTGWILRVPEPSVLSLLVLGLLGWAAVRKNQV